MTRDEAREYILAHATEYLKPDGNGKGYICPVCGSGSGRHGTGLQLGKNGRTFTCFAGGCVNGDHGGDIIDVIGAEFGLTDYNEKLAKAADLFRITIDRTGREQAESTHEATTKRRGSGESTQEKPVKREPLPEIDTTDYAAFFLQANRNIEKTTYHRGLTLETLNRFKIGYVEQWRHPKAPSKVPFTPRLIVPTSRQSYLARDTRENLTEREKQYSKSKVGKVRLFNLKALEQTENPVFIVEGEIDALSIEDVGGHAVATGSTSNIGLLLEHLEKHRPAQPLLLALDNDKAGAAALEKLEEGLKRLDIPFYRYSPNGEYKDANEALQGNRAAFTAAVKKGETLPKEREEQAKEEYLSNSTARHLQEFIDGIAASVNTPYISTGFSALDEILDGGLYEGLYIIGAISSLGKTTLVLQMADQIAQQGKDVLIFSLEMARNELMAKSISRHTIQRVINGDAKGDTRNAKTNRGITTGAKYADYSDTERQLIQSAIQDYSQYAEHIYILEGVGDIGAAEIGEAVENHIKYTGRTPVVVVDYLQLIAPADPRATEKMNTDKAVMELKRISRDRKTPVIGISSFNRANYNTPVSMVAFKESGAIEYSSDVLFGLQLRGVGEEDFDVNEAKRADPREIELVILKNRNGRTGDKINFNYYAMFNFFEQP